MSHMLLILTPKRKEDVEVSQDPVVSIAVKLIGTQLKNQSRMKGINSMPLRTPQHCIPPHTHPTRLRKFHAHMRSRSPPLNTRSTARDDQPRPQSQKTGTSTPSVGPARCKYPQIRDSAQAQHATLCSVLNSEYSRWRLVS
jgi:hypothetical protein